VLQLPEVQEFVAEARERHALMTTRRARRYQRGSLCKSDSGEIWYGKYYPAPGAPQKRVQLGRTSEMDDKGARTALDDIVAALNRNPAHALGAEPVRRFVEQVYIPQKYENGDWRRATGQEAEYLFRRSILSEIGELRCRDLKAAHLRAVLRKLASTGLSYESVSKVKCAMGDMVKRMVAEECLTSNIAAGLKTPKTARRSDRSFAPPSCDLGGVLASVDRSRRKGAPGVRPGDVLRVARIGGLWIEKRRFVPAGSDPRAEVVVQGRH